jgi:hypothetical protein
VDDREQAGGEHAEHGHRLGDAVDGAAEVRAEQEQDRRNQRAAVRDADPEHEVRDVARPHHRPRVAGDADALHDLIALGDQRDGEDREVDQEDRPPDRPRLADGSERILVERLLRQPGIGHAERILAGSVAHLGLDRDFGHRLASLMRSPLRGRPS